MRPTRGRRTIVAAATLLGLAFSILGANIADAKELDIALCAPDRNRFTLDIGNEFLPLQLGRQWSFVGEDEGITVGLQIDVLDETKTLFNGRAKVTTRVVQETEWEDADGDGVVGVGESLIEVSLNYFAQTQDGTVCYFGEDVDIYEDGQVVSHEGAWRADEPGNAPGIFMPASPMEGMSFAQEVAPGIAEDEATIVGSGTVEVPAGTFADTIRVREFNPLDGGKGYKAYARGVGLILDDTLALVRYSVP
ncbi:MAG TPA: hypothetical protein VJ300_05675 [Thermoplasmata archaeon]|nr:hypothetical protein [Thermoplasmata archaeon]